MVTEQAETNHKSSGPVDSQVAPLERLPFLLVVIGYCTIGIGIFWLWVTYNNIFNDSKDTFVVIIISVAVELLVSVVTAGIGIGLLMLNARTRKGMIGLSIFYLCVDAFIIFVSMDHILILFQVIVMAIPIILYVPAIILLTRPRVKALFAAAAIQRNGAVITMEAMDILPANSNE